MSEHMQAAKHRENWNSAARKHTDTPWRLWSEKAAVDFEHEMVKGVDNVRSVGESIRSGMGFVSR
jgi:hypothetical protein